MKSPLLVLALSLPLAAQDAVVRQAAINQTTQLAELARSMLSEAKGLALTADGRVWALVHFQDGSWNGTGTGTTAQDLSRDLLLMVSGDGGRTWTKAGSTRTTGDGYGSLATDPDGHTLHVAWSGWNGEKTSAGKFFNSVRYSTFDTLSGQWAGTKDEVLVQGVDDYTFTYANPDIAVTRTGTVGVVFHCARGVPPGWVGGGGSWHCGLLWKLPGGKWSAPHRVNDDSSGVSADIHALGEDFHLCYRVTVGGYGIEYRRFDTVAGKFGAEGPIPVNADTSNPTRNAAGTYANNVAQLGVMDDGGLWLLWANAPNSTSGGKLWISYSAPGKYAFTSRWQVDDDSGMGWGNNTYRHYALARTAGGNLVVIYSKKAESHKTLYMRTLTGAGPIPAHPANAITLRTGTANDQFLQISGYRVPMTRANTILTWSDLAPIGPLTGGRVLIGNPGAAQALQRGAGCRGNLSQSPVLAPGSIPGLGGSFQLEFSRHPASTGGALILGGDDQKLFGSVPLPLPLAGLGMGGCQLWIDVLSLGSYVVDAQGAATVTVPVPNDTSLAGATVFWQGFVLAKGANQAGALVTDGLASTLR